MHSYGVLHRDLLKIVAQIDCAQTEQAGQMEGLRNDYLSDVAKFCSCSSVPASALTLAFDSIWV